MPGLRPGDAVIVRGKVQEIAAGTVIIKLDACEGLAAVPPEAAEPAGWAGLQQDAG